MTTDNTLQALAKLAAESNTDLVSLQKGLSKMTAKDLIELQRVITGRLAAKIDGM